MERERLGVGAAASAARGAAAGWASWLPWERLKRWLSRWDVPGYRPAQPRRSAGPQLDATPAEEATAGGGMEPSPGGKSGTRRVQLPGLCGDVLEVLIGAL